MDYKDYLPTKKILRMYMALALLPHREMKTQAKNIKRKVNDLQDQHLRRQLKIFHAQYISGFWMKKVSPQMISVYGLSHKSNNALQCFQSHISRMLPGNATFLNFFARLERHFLLDSANLLSEINAGKFVTQFRQGIKTSQNR